MTDNATGIKWLQAEHMRDGALAKVTRPWVAQGKEVTKSNGLMITATHCDNLFAHKWQPSPWRNVASFARRRGLTQATHKRQQENGCTPHRGNGSVKACRNEVLQLTGLD
jgi:hypothetical protein